MLVTKLTTPIISRSLKSLRQPIFSQIIRANSSSSEAKPSEHKAKALSLIDSLPGNNIVSKTGFVTLGATLSTWLISKEIYIVNEETVIAAAFFIVWYNIIKNFREPFNAFAQSRIDLIKNMLEDARVKHKETIQARIGESTQLSDIVPVTKDLFAMSKEMAEMQAQIFTLKQQVQVATEIKSTLDSWVRYENALREREQKLVANQILSNIQKSLTDPKMQASLLKEAIADVQKLTARK